MLDKLKRNFMVFIQGRYGSRGPDLLTRRLFSAVGILAVLALVLFVFDKANSLVLALGLGLYIFSYYRLFSKNIAKRIRENEAYKSFEARFTKSFLGIKRRIFGTKDYVYTNCTKCKTQIRFPRNKGKLKVTCPSCKNIFIKRT